MSLDFTSLLLATGISGICLSLMMVVTWLSARSESFMLTWAAGIAVIVAHVFCYGLYFENPSPHIFPVLVSLLVIGLSVVFAASLQFCYGMSPARPAAIASCLGLAAVLTPLAWGLDGLSLILENAVAAALLALTGAVYLANRVQARAQMTVLFVLYSACGISFGLCGAVLLAERAWMIGHAPDNWAERLNIVVSVSGMSGAGAISLALHHSRLARRHELESLTDPLTGLLNRRALFARWGERKLGAFCAVAIFDLDHFKSVNDCFGHAAGDTVLGMFGRLLEANRRPQDLAIRLGGEEFALLMPRIMPRDAIAAAERVRTSFAGEAFTCGGSVFSCTVSVGIASGVQGGASLDTVLVEADRALYAAKRGGRDRIGLEELRAAG